MTPLELEIRERIETEGPMSVADYMALCLTHPQHGYYTTGTPVGGRASASREGGDFITAPEISQMFGELIGVWCMEVWQALGSPARFNLVEIGPGRGTLMSDLLRVARALPDFLDAADVHLIEISPTLAEQQSLLLSDQSVPLKWINSIEALPEAPTILIANEFLDALPLRQWVKHKNQWFERAISFDTDKLVFTTRPNTIPLSELPIDHGAQPNGTIFETAPAREALVSNLCERIKGTNGAALLIDYGHMKSGFGETFQAVKDHAYTDVLNAPGAADLTSHVDFAPLKGIAEAAGCSVPAPITHGKFLLDLGLLERAGNLGAERDATVQENLRIAVERLAAPDQMGDLFKVMAFGSPTSFGARWPGFA